MICKRKSIFISLLIAFDLFIAALVFTQIVEATGGAFPSTKMGGNDVDDENSKYGSWVGGVNRSINDATPWSLGANAAPEYSVYQSAECNHCHEIHASFGGQEPIPSDGGPHPYLTFKDAQGDELGSGADFCLYCHDKFNFSSINSSDSGLGDPPEGFGSLGVFQNNVTTNVFKNSSHGKKNGFLWPKPDSDPSQANTIHPRRTRSTGKRTCLNCHTPHGIMGKAGAAYDTDAVPENVQLKPGTHPTTGRTLVGDIIAPYLIPRNKIAWEEALCENCHDANGSAVDTSPPNIQDEINKRDMPACGASTGCGSGHPVDITDYAGQHSTKEPVENRERHVECYDCHNPHAVRNPADGFPAGDAGRIMGVKYVTIDGTVQIAGVGTARQPYIMELCFRCHGDTFAFVSRRSATNDASNDNPFVAFGADLGDYTGTVQRKNRGNYNLTGRNEQLGWSNKRIEFNSGTPHTAAGQGSNTAFHPVAEPGRNLSFQLCNQLKSAFILNCTDPGPYTGTLPPPSTWDNQAALANLTINCTDCHNNNDTGGGNRGPVTESSLRSTDKASVYGGASPVGPHGSDNPRILRAFYNTRMNETAATVEVDRGPNDDIAIGAMDSNFALCFLCHNSGPFKNKDYGEPDLDAGESMNWTNFQGDAEGGQRWAQSLHWMHLSQRQDPVNNSSNFIKCHECHNNVHSNVEANNTKYILGTDTSTFTPDKHTHLINFGPQAVGASYLEPRWYYDTTNNVFRCNLQCHGQNMAECAYLGKHDGGPGGFANC